MNVVIIEPDGSWTLRGNHPLRKQLTGPPLTVRGDLKRGEKEKSGSYSDAVRDAAARFRSALGQGGLRLKSLACFPKGSCGDVSEMLGQYLSDSGLGAWGFRDGTDPDVLVTHAWIEQRGLIIDITADQFVDVSEPVIVTEDRTWHDARFPSGPSRRAANMRWFDSREEGAEALADYEVLRQRADEL